MSNKCLPAPVAHPMKTHSIIFSLAQNITSLVYCYILKLHILLPLLFKPCCMVHQNVPSRQTVTFFQLSMNLYLLQIVLILSALVRYAECHSCNPIKPIVIFICSTLNFDYTRLCTCFTEYTPTVMWYYANLCPTFCLVYVLVFFACYCVSCLSCAPSSSYQEGFK